MVELETSIHQLPCLPTYSTPSIYELLWELSRVPDNREDSQKEDKLILN